MMPDKGAIALLRELLLNSSYHKNEADRAEVLTMQQTTLPINLSQEEIQQFCQRHSIRKLSLFGSVLRDDFTRESDIDVLVEFESGKIPGLAIITMQDELSNLINRQVDLRTAADLSRYFRDRVLAEAMVIYEQS
jgi:hypothetical protein